MDEFKFKPDYLENNNSPQTQITQQKANNNTFKKSDIVNKLKENKIAVIAVLVILFVLIIFLVYILFKGKKPKLPIQPAQSKVSGAPGTPPQQAAAGQQPSSQVQQTSPPGQQPGTPGVIVQQPMSNQTPIQQQPPNQTRKVGFAEPPVQNSGKNNTQESSFDKLVDSIDDKELNKFINAENQSKIEAKKPVEDNIDSDEEPEKESEESEELGEQGKQGKQGEKQTGDDISESIESV